MYNDTLHNLCGIGAGATLATTAAASYSPAPANALPLILGLLTVIGQIVNQILIRKNNKKNELQTEKAG